MKEYRIENKYHRLILLTDVHYTEHCWHHIPPEQRMKSLTGMLKKEYEERPYDAILCLGDYSLDFWMWGRKGSYLNTPQISHTALFCKEILSDFPAKTYMIPGNHEQYGEEKWKELTGYPREFALLYDNKVFLMCDTFHGNLDPTEHSDGRYTGLNTAFLKEAIRCYPDKELYLCMHDLIAEEESDVSRQLLQERKRFPCGFAGHIHQSKTVLFDHTFGFFPLFYCGDFSYTSGVSDAEKPHWGFRSLDFSEEGRMSTDFHLYSMEKSTEI